MVWVKMTALLRLVIRFGVRIWIGIRIRFVIGAVTRIGIRIRIGEKGTLTLD